MSTDAVELEVTSADLFPVRDALLQLRIGDAVMSTVSRYADGDDLHTLIFALTPDSSPATSYG